MYAKILILLVLAILCTGCTDPDLPDMNLDLDGFANVTPDAPAFTKIWDADTQTISIVSPADVVWLTIEKVSTEPDLCTFTEILNVTAHVNYNLNAVKDFKFGWVQHSGKKGITCIDVSKLVNEPYEVVVDDYGIMKSSRTVYNNETGLNETTVIFMSVVIGNHTETQYRNVWKAWIPSGNTLFAGESAVVKIVYHKPPELGNVRIQTIPMFAGIECEELTWWNTSWGYKIDSVVADENFPYQMNLTVHGGSGTNNETDVFLDGHNSTNFDDIRFTLGDTTNLVYWIQDNTTDPVKVWINVTANSTVNMYYGNAGASIASSISDTMIFGDDFDDASVDTPKWTTTGSNVVESGGTLQITGADSWNTNGITSDVIFDRSSQGYIMTSRVKTSVASGHKIFGYGPQPLNVDNGLYNYLDGSGWRARYDGANGAVFTTFAADTWYYSELLLKQTQGYTFFVDGTQYDDDSSFADNNHRININQYSSGQTIHFDYIFVRNYATVEPTWGTWGSEQTALIISAYTPSTPLSKTVSDSQLFTVNTSETSQCRWYINGLLKQTNSTGATRHEYLNSSLDEGYWNFTATANTTDTTSSQTWWVTVSAVGTFEQDMYIDRWMYVTYLNSSNTNLSEFFTDLSPYYLSFYNATDQKTYNYKSGRWEKYADKIIKPGEAAMLRYTSNVTKTRDNASGTFGFTMKTGLNHIGHSYNGSRNLAWYNTTISSANLVTIAHQNPETGTLSTFTYGSADNGSVDVLQGCGVEVNVSADTVISGL